MLKFNVLHISQQREISGRVVDQVKQPVPQTLAAAMTVAAGTYSAHFRKLPGESYLVLVLYRKKH